jgi:hypothetical protein
MMKAWTLAARPKGTPVDSDFDLADRAALHRLAELEGRDIALRVVHPAAHIGVDRPKQ